MWLLLVWQTVIGITAGAAVAVGCDDVVGAIATYVFGLRPIVEMEW